MAPMGSVPMAPTGSAPKLDAEEPKSTGTALGTLLLLLYYSRPGDERYKSLRASNTSPPQNRFARYTLASRERGDPKSICAGENGS